MKWYQGTTLLLLSANLALIGGTALVWSRGQERVAEPARLNVPLLSLPDLSALNSIPMNSVDVNTIREQAAFYASRSFYRAPVTPVQVPPPEYDMNGTLRLPEGKRMAFVKKRADQLTRTLHVGDDLDGWRVQTIDADRILLDLNGQTAELHTTGAAVPGLIRGTASPRTAVTGIRILGGPSLAGQSGGVPVGPQAARLYRPPQTVPK